MGRVYGKTQSNVASHPRTIDDAIRESRELAENSLKSGQLIDYSVDLPKEVKPSVISKILCVFIVLINLIADTYCIWISFH